MYLYFRQSDNVLDDKHWGIIKVHFMGYLEGARPYKMEVVYWGDTMPSLSMGTTIATYQEWLARDYTGNHPESCNEVWDGGFGKWISSCTRPNLNLNMLLLGYNYSPPFATS